MTKHPTPKKSPRVLMSEPPPAPPITSCCELPAELHAHVKAVALAGDRTFASQLRLIVREWAKVNP